MRLSCDGSSCRASYYSTQKFQWQTSVGRGRLWYEYTREVIDDKNVESKSGRAKVVEGEMVAIIPIDSYNGYRNCNVIMVQWEYAASVTPRHGLISG